MRYYYIGFYGRYFLLSNVLLHMGHFATGARYTYKSELPANCPGIQDNSQELYNGQMKYIYYNVRRTGKVQTADGNKRTCDIINSRNQQPFLRIEFDKPILINYVSIILNPMRTYGWHVATFETNDKFECKHYECKITDWPLKTSLFQCSGPPGKELSIKWTGLNSMICEIQIFTDKTCGHLPQLENGSYIVSSTANVSNNLFQIGTNATMQCSELFQPSHFSFTPTIIQCETSGQWSFSNITCQRIPNEEGMHQYLNYTIPIVIVILILIILAITWILLYHKKVSNKMEKPKIELKTTVYIEHKEYDDPLYESVDPLDNTSETCGSNTQPQHVFMLKPRDTSSTSRPRDYVSLYENLDSRPDIIQHTTNSPNSDSCHEISTICSPSREKSISSEFVINDLYASVSK